MASHKSETKGLVGGVSAEESSEEESNESESEESELDEDAPDPIFSSARRLDSRRLEPEIEFRQAYGLDWQLVRRFRRIWSIMFPSICCDTSRALWIQLVGAVLNKLALVITMKTLLGPLGAAAAARDVAKLVEVTVSFFPLLTVIICLSVFLHTLQNFLNVWVRQRVTNHVHSLITAPSALYRLTSPSYQVPGIDVIDNCDHRATTDVADLSHHVVHFFVGEVLPSIMVIVVWSCSGRAVAHVIGFWTCMFLVQTALCLPVISRTAHYLFQQDSVEGSFRFAHSRLREYSECIAFYGGEVVERVRLRHLFEQVVINFKKVILWEGIQRSIAVFQDPMNPCHLTGHAFTTVAILCTSALQTDLYGDDLSPPESGELTVKERTANIGKLQEMNALLAMSGAILNIITNIGALAPLAGSTHRVGELIERLEGLQEEQATEDDGTATEEGLDVLEVSGVTLRTPDGSFLISRPVEFRVEVGQHLAIVGPSGCGKSTLLRRLCGFGGAAGTDGLVRRPARIGCGGILFVPQSPYVFESPLRMQVTYPESPVDGEDEEAAADQDERLWAILKTVGLQSLAAEGIGEVADWGNRLSVGEQQRLGFARVLFHRPRFALMDEGTSALDIDSERTCMEACVEAGCTFVSIAHRLTAIAMHQRVLRLDPDSADWVIRDSSLEKERAGAWKSLLPADSGDSTPVVLDTEVANGESSEAKDASPSHGLLESWRNFGDLYVSTRMTGERMRWATVYLFGVALIITLVFFLYSAYADAFTLLANRRLADTVQVLPRILVFAFLGSGLYAITFFFVARRLGLVWRKNIVRWLHDAYLESRHFYIINVLEHYDDPVQRITQDTTELMTQAVMFAAGDLNGPGACYLILMIIVLCIYINTLSWKLWSVVLFMRFVVLLCIGWLPKIIYDREYAVKTRFADFRFLHARLRVFTEAVSIYHGEELERARLDASFSDLVGSLKHLIWGQMYISWVTSFVMEVQAMIETPLVGMLANYNPGDIHMYIMAQYAAGLLKTLSQEVVFGFACSGTLLGYANRVSDLKLRLQRLRKEAENVAAKAAETESKAFDIREVPLCTPQGRPLQKQVMSFSVPAGSAGLVIVGRSGCGKSTILRMLAGLIQPRGGTIRMPSSEQTFLMPQRPYLVQGTLLQQVVYPEKADVSDKDGRVEAALQAAHLTGLLRRFNLTDSMRWDDILSLGEQQRLGFARLFHKKVSFAIMDESTSSLDVETEEACLGACRSRGITLISVAHRPSVLRFHDTVLRLLPGGTHDLVPVSDLAARS